MEVDFTLVHRLVEKLLANGDAKGVINEAKRFVTRLSQKPDFRSAYELVNRLSNHTDFHRTRQTPNYFRRIRDTLNLLRTLPNKEQAVVLGWACRLAPYEAMKHRQRQNINGGQSTKGKGAPQQPRQGGKHR